MRTPIFIRPFTQDEQRQIQAGLRSSDAFVMRRCQILRASARGERAPAIARQLGCDDQSVRNVIHEFNTSGLHVLQEGSSRPHRLRTAFTQEGAERLKDLLHRSPHDFGQERSTWTLVTLAPLLGELLLDQRVCAGIGNIYKCESLWIHRLDPWQPSEALDDEALRRLYSAARDLMRRNLVTPIARQRHAVHARGGRSCPRCGTPIRIQPQGEHARLTYFCPRCQGVPVARPMAGRIASR